MTPENMWQRVGEEDHESLDHRVRPLEERLARIFQIKTIDGKLVQDLCRSFIEPIFARGALYDDAIPALQEAKSRDIKTAIVSNTPWGSPAGLWREEGERLGLGELTDTVVFCREVGWSKPAKQVFLHTLDQLGSQPSCSLFVGDDPRWDLVGPESIGMEAVLINRQGMHPNGGERSIETLNQIWDRLVSMQ